MITCITKLITTHLIKHRPSRKLTQHDWETRWAKPKRTPKRAKVKAARKQRNKK